MKLSWTILQNLQKESHTRSCKTIGCHVPTRWPCPSTNHSCSLKLIGWTWASLPKSLLILLVTTKLLLAQSAASLRCAHPFLLSPSPLPKFMNPLCGEIVIQVDYTVNWVMEDWILWKWISAAAVCLSLAWFIYYNWDYFMPRTMELWRKSFRCDVLWMMWWRAYIDIMFTWVQYKERRT